MYMVRGPIKIPHSIKLLYSIDASWKNHDECTNMTQLSMPTPHSCCCRSTYFVSLPVFSVESVVDYTCGSFKSMGCGGTQYKENDSAGTLGLFLDEPLLVSVKSRLLGITSYPPNNFEMRSSIRIDKMPFLLLQLSVGPADPIRADLKNKQEKYIDRGIFWRRAV